MNDLIQWYLAGGEGPMALWRWGGIVALVVWAWVAYRVMRRLMGHRKWLGTWYSAEQMEVIVQDLRAKQESGGRVMSPVELELLRKHFGVATNSIRRDRGWF